MKLKAITFGVVVTSALSMPVLADVGHGAQGLPVLERGTSDTQILTNGVPDRFQINIDHPTTLRVSSMHFSGVSSQGVNIKATLYDDNGNPVAEDSSPQGHFQLTRQLEPGNYQLEVSGTSAGSGHENTSNRYDLHVSY
ncbi:hypothetical protein IOC61_01110 [Halomonas sp. KAO]|uniref:hypothetical protein n=1 Tax=unclassified Halomonas TaxID=2609666 RepID=UPI0018A0D4B3|nr:MULTISPECIES: hypothetical protein [unclassified Halomonas]MBF7051916.1 hypothetical protein [Halomonas sp. KAO]MDT0501358.1 hypothetical protein [Halomonas sp. PAR7]MDT0512118.1 hypothetical protein [Halomonas sp. LES1]MDT0590745.1 hypothetical protein [Halomonas sp. PAR8]